MQNSVVRVSISFPLDRKITTTQQQHNKVKFIYIVNRFVNHVVLGDTDFWKPIRYF